MYKSRRILIIVFIAVGAAGVISGTSEYSNYFTLMAMMVMVLFGIQRGSERGTDLPAPRWRGFEVLIPAVAAFAVAAPTLALPFLSDDHPHRQQHGSIESGWHVLYPEAGHSFYRPVGWLLWWLIGKYHISAELARGFAILLFSATSAIAVPAMKRIGAPRGVALWSAVLFACHPHSLEAIAWLSNFYSFLSLLFALAAIITIPPFRATPTRWILGGLLATLSFLSKEEAILWLPAVALLAAARFKISRAGRAPWLAWPICVMAVAAVLIRIPILGDLGGYRVPETGKPLPLTFYTGGILAALDAELPSRYLIPVRASLYSMEVKKFIELGALLFPALIIFARPGRGGARALAMLLCIMPLLVIPVAPMLPSGAYLSGARLLYSLSIFISLAAVSSVASMPLRVSFKIVILLLLAGASFAAGRENISAWQQAGEYMNEGLALAAPAIRKLQSADPSRGAIPLRVAILGFPDSVNGAYCFRNAAAAAVELECGIPQLHVAETFDDIGLFDHVFYVDYSKKQLSRVPADTSRVRMLPGTSVTFPLDRDAFSRGMFPTGEFPRIQYLGVRAGKVGDRTRVSGAWQGSSILLPTIASAPNATFRLTWDGSVKGGPITILATTKINNRFKRILYQEGEIIHAGTDGIVSIEIRLPFGSALEYSTFLVENLEK